jgi:amino acid adenylation domain-containing protein/non-ribosomal peptide synthase protein (TIGR01720 family)
MEVFVTPASSAQKRLWFIDRLEPGNAAYHIPIALRLKGIVQKEIIQRCIQEVIARHEILRTTFAFEEGETMQVIHPANEVELEEAFVNPSSLDSLLQQEARKPFDLVEGPLLRARLFRIDAQEVVFMMCIHHIVSDGWSMDVLIKEFSECYQAFAAGREPILPELGIQYADYAEWQHDEEAKGTSRKHLDIWKQNLSGNLPLSELPADNPRPAVQSFKGSIERFEVPASFLAGLDLIEKEQGVTRFMVLLAVFKLLMHRYTDDEDILIGTPVANRQLSDVEPLIGLFVNTVVLRTTINESSSFVSVLQDVKQTCLDAFAHQDIPFETLVDVLQPNRDRSRSPLFQVMFVHQSAPWEHLELGELIIEFIDVPTQTSKFDVTFMVRESSEGMSLLWEFSTDLFEPETVNQWSDHYRNLLAAVSQNQHAPIHELPLMGSNESEQLIHAGLRSQKAFETQKTIHHRVSQMAQSMPSHIAIECDDEQCTYEQLEIRSNQIAHFLIEKGAGPNVLIGVCVERSIDMVTALLGILKSGSAYLPLDPAYPEDRLSFMIEDSGIRLLISDTGRFQNADLESLCLDRDEEAIRCQSSMAPVVHIHSNQAAYVIYTSGSTGKPKGVVVEHQQVLRLMESTDEWFGFNQDDVWTLFHSFAFDFSVWELWGALFYGGKLVVVPYLVSRSPDLFYDLVAERKVTVLNQTPSAFRSFMAEDEERSASLQLRYVIFGGEALEVPMLRGWFERHGPDAPQMVNMYGITETTVHVTWRPLKLSDADFGKGSVVGVPIPDLDLLVLDRWLQPVPFGVAGELYVGGAGVARGYLHRPGLTAGRFVPNPFGNGRLYRTGDVARRRRDGDIEFIGRNDSQVKIRGFRVELGEIESTLSTHSGVRHAVALVYNEQRLIAYVVRENNELTVEGLLEVCRQRLPAYMMPSAMVFIDEIPMTPQGKLDKNALPLPDLNQSVGHRAYEPPMDGMEKIIANVWSNVLGVSQVGRHDNFFELGGDSILSLQVVAKCRAAHIRITPKSIFEYQTIAELGEQAEFISTATTQPTEHSIEMLPGHDSNQSVAARANAKEAYPLSPLQSGILFQTLYEPEVGVYFEQISGEIVGAFNEVAFSKAWQVVCDRHAILRTSFIWRDVDVPLQLIHEQVEVPMRFMDWQGNTSVQVAKNLETFLRDDRGMGFDLDQAPLMRLCVIRTEVEKWIWVWSHHHLLLDGWSVSLIFKEVLQIYEATCRSKPLELPLSNPYSQYIAWVESQDKQLAKVHWIRVLQGFSRPSSIQLAEPKDISTEKSHEVVSVINEQDTTVIQAWARQHKLTLSAVVQGAWALLLRAYGAGDDLVYGVTVSGRTPDLDGADQMVGLFINTLPLRVRFSPDGDIEEWLQSIQKQQTDMRQFEYSRLVDIQEWSDLRPGEALFDNIFVFENYPVDESLTHQTGLLQVRNVRYFEKTNYPLTASASPGDRMTMRINFDSTKFDVQTMERMLIHWRQLLMGIVLNESVPSPYSKRERSELAMWSQNKMEFEPPRCIHYLIEYQAKRQPNAIALQCGTEQLTYAELDRKANQLAHLIQKRGLHPESSIAICMERSVNVFVAVFGVLKAGGCFVPLDPRNGSYRLGQILEDASVIGLVTDEVMTDRVPETLQGWRIHLENDQKIIETMPATQVSTLVSVHHLAYMIFTSGSTGRPKGVMIQHAGVHNLCEAHQRQLDIASPMNALGVASFGFDASVAEAFPTFSVGATLCIAPEGTTKTPIEFVRLMNEQKISFAILTPGMLSAFSPEDFPYLKTLLIAGEAASLSLFQQWSQGRRVFNAYGPTENTVCATLEEIEDTESSICLGKPMANIRVYVLDPQLRPTPIGVTGEICLTGAGLARGYVGQAGLTGERFIPDPLTEKPGARMYLTGDLGRLRSDGRVEFLGRRDHQVKIRGFRVELGEIEAALETHPNIQTAIVRVFEPPHQGPRLCGYFSTKDDDSLLLESLRSFVEDTLPDYMVPAHFMEMVEWPLTNNGKIDRQALISPVESSDASPKEHLLPRSTEEKALTSIWEEVLGARQIGLSDNFFELGGDSILSLQIIARAYKAGFEISPKDLFSHPTVEKLAPLVKKIEKASISNAAVRGESQLTPIQNWFFEQNNPVPHHWNQAVLLEVRDALDIDVLELALAHLVKHHDALRFRYEDQTQRYEETVNMDGVLKQIDGTVLDDNQFAASLKAVSAELQSSLNLKEAPLMRVAYFNRGGDCPGRLLWVIHHLIVDGVSWRVLLEDLGTVYRQAAQNEPLSLPGKTSSYAQWASLLTEQAQTERFHKQFEYWCGRHCSNVLPLDFPDDAGGNWTRDAETFTVHLTAAETESLLRDVPAVYHTQINDVLLTALLVVFTEWTGRDRLYIELEGHGREELDGNVDITRTVGWFTTIFPVLLEKQSSDFGTLLPSVKEQLRQIPDNGIGFGLLRYLSHEETVRSSLASSPKAQISFNYLGQSDQLQSDNAAFRMSKDEMASGQSEQGARLHLLEFVGLVTHGQLKMDWVYSRRMHQRETITHLANGYVNALRGLIDHCLRPDAGGYTPSDFSKVDLNDRELDAIMEDLEL